MRRWMMLVVLWMIGSGLALAGKGLTALVDRPVAPDFVLEDLSGKIHRLADYRGKVVMINFWATWCPPCRAEMPSLQRAWDRLHPEGIELLAVNVGEDENQMFISGADGEYRFPILLDRDRAVLKLWPVRGLPTTLVVDKQGRIVYTALGGREWDAPEVLAEIRALK